MVAEWSSHDEAWADHTSINNSNSSLGMSRSCTAVRCVWFTWSHCGFPLYQSLPYFTALPNMHRLENPLVGSCWLRNGWHSACWFHYGGPFSTKGRWTRLGLDSTVWTQKKAGDGLPGSVPIVVIWCRMDSYGILKLEGVWFSLFWQGWSQAHLSILINIPITIPGCIGKWIKTRNTYYYKYRMFMWQGDKVFKCWDHSTLSWFPFQSLTWWDPTYGFDVVWPKVKEQWCLCL